MMFWEIMVMKDLFPYLKTRHEIYQKVILGGLRPRIPLRSWPTGIPEMISKAWKPLSEKRPNFSVLCHTLRTVLNNEFYDNNDINMENRNKLLRDRSSHSLEGLLVSSPSTKEEEEEESI